MMLSCHVAEKSKNPQFVMFFVTKAKGGPSCEQNNGFVFDQAWSKIVS